MSTACTRAVVCAVVARSLIFERFGTGCGVQFAPGPGTYPTPTSMGKQALSTKRSAPNLAFKEANRSWEYFNVRGEA